MAGYRVFSQSSACTVDIGLLDGVAGQHFSAHLRGTPSSDGRHTLVLFRAESRAQFSVHVRKVADVDLQAARDAEVRGRAGGMAALAARCPTVWEIEPADGTEFSAVMHLCAIVAFAHLGPVLPPDGSTLFGVRGARERAGK
jgi:hypothetical protein